jgi:hypothetical protein
MNPPILHKNNAAYKAKKKKKKENKNHLLPIS